MCPECSHRVGLHYAASNAMEQYGKSCSVWNCDCSTYPFECCDVGRSLTFDLQEAVRGWDKEASSRIRSELDAHRAGCRPKGRGAECPSCGLSGAFGALASCVRCGYRPAGKVVVG